MAIDTEELKKIVQKHTVIFGSTEVIKRIKQGKVAKVYLAANVPKNIEDDIMHNASISKTEVEKITMPNYELGMVFKRVHPVLALGIMKE
jgi:ribosomal protein L30E